MPSVIERPKFLTDLLAEVDAFEAVYESHDLVKSGENPCGTLGPWLVRAYSLARYYGKQAKLIAVERDYDNDQFNNDPEIKEIMAKVEMLMDIVWPCVRAEFSLWTESNIGVRKNFTVIRSEEADDDDGFKKFLMRMFNK